MSTPDQPETPQLTRRQLRELRNTASTPIITTEDAEAAAAAAAAAETDAPIVEAPAAPTPPVAAPLPRPAVPVPAVTEPPAAADVDLHAPALTRRAARQQERLRTASIPVIAEEAIPQGADAEAPVENAADEVAAAADTDAVESRGDEGGAGVTPADEVAAEPENLDDAPSDESEQAEVAEESDEPDVADEAASDEAASVDLSDENAGDDDDLAILKPAAEDAEGDAAPIVAPTFGSELLAGEVTEVELPASFDQLLARGTGSGGALTASNALILSQTPETGSLTAPVAATGEVIITGMYNLPESLSSTGALHGSSDGKEADAVLVDGELPATSSPTPIAASAAISTIKSSEDIIKPPAPEKGSRLMLALVITAGALALALTGVLIVALVTGAVG